MDDKVNEILERLPPKPPRSRLDPHATLIEEMRRRGRTFRAIWLFFLYWHHYVLLMRLGLLQLLIVAPVPGRPAAQLILQLQLNLCHKPIF